MDHQFVLFDKMSIDN